MGHAERHTPRRELVTAPSVEPITTSEVKEHARVYTTDDDSLISSLIGAVRSEFETRTGLVLIDQTWRCTFDQPAVVDNLGWWDGEREGALSMSVADFLRIDPGPVSAISSVKYYSEDGTENTMSSSLYFLDAASSPARVVLAQGAVWPSGLRARNALAVEFVAGYGAGASSVPADVRHALKLAAAHRYEHRGESATQSAENAALKILDPAINRYRRRSV